jgi:hypothetical protein
MVARRLYGVEIILMDGWMDGWMAFNFRYFMRI